MNIPDIPTPFDELAETCAALLDIYIRWAKRRGLGANEFFVLYMLGHGPCTAKEICEEWYLPKQTVSFVCRQLQEKGWLAAETDERDKRGKLLRLTAGGEAAVLPMIAELTQREAQTAEAFGPRELATLLQGLHRLHAMFAEQLELSDES